MKSILLMKGPMAPKQSGGSKMKGKKEPIQDLMDKDGQWDVEKFMSRKIGHQMSGEEDIDLDSKKKSWLDAMMNGLRTKSGDGYSKY